MRPLASRRLTVLAITAALTLGAAGSALADEHHPTRPAPAAVEADAPTPRTAGEVAAEVAARVSAGAAAEAATRADSETPARKAVPADPIGDTVAAVEKTVADLLASLPLGGVTDLVSQITTPLTSLIDQLVESLLGGLPLPDLPALPELPADPPATAPQLPAEAPLSAP
ncbi:hypothetical protein [Streptomyces sp. NPDC053755]|uniref:hypothetical protein n=1 Tax=Streptomyces sp. NPDC053755 TaxID=3155815 RepID=UPI00341C36AB